MEDTQMNEMLMDNDSLDMAGDWRLTYGYTVGLTTDDTPAQHWIPDKGTSRTFEVHFELEGSSDHGMKYKGHYKGFENHPLGQPGSLVAETFYANRGVYTVQIIEQADALQYFALLSGKHQRYPTDDPERVEIVGGWADIGGNVANFTLVKILDRKS
jgi:hypothetical protein